MKKVQAEQYCDQFRGFSITTDGNSNLPAGELYGGDVKDAGDGLALSSLFR